MSYHEYTGKGIVTRAIEVDFTVAIPVDATAMGARALMEAAAMNAYIDSGRAMEQSVHVFNFSRGDRLDKVDPK